MAVLSEVQAGLLTQDELVAGIIEDIITVNQMYQVLPFDNYEGTGLTVNRENVLAGAGLAAVGASLAGAVPANGIPSIAGVGAGTNFKDPATWTQETFTLKTIIGDAEVNGLVQAQLSDMTDQTASQIAAKAKQVGRIYQDLLINGNESVSSLQFDGLLVLADSQVDATGGGALSFIDMDTAMDEVKDKDGVVDYIVMASRTRRAYKALLRALGGAAIDDVVTLESGDIVIAYEGVPIFRNEYMPTDLGETAAQTDTAVIFGTFDDGTRQYGVAGLTSRSNGGIMVDEIGALEGSDATLTRVKWYAGLAQFSRKGLTILANVTN
jgi:hypothetical protein